MQGYELRLVDWEGEFTEGPELPGKWKVAKEMMGRRLSQEEAKRLLAFEGDEGSAQVIQLLHRELHRFTSAPIDAMTRPVEDISVSLHDDARGEELSRRAWSGEEP